MCAVSAVGDYWKDNFPDRHPWYPSPAITPTNPFTPNPINPAPINVVPTPAIDVSKLVTKEQLEALRKEMQELKELIKTAMKYDEATDQPHCENEDKLRLIKEVAKAVGVDLSDLGLNT